MALDLVWAGAWRRLGPDDSMGLVTGVRVGMGSARKAPAAGFDGGSGAVKAAVAERVERPGIESKQMEPVRKEPETRPNGRVRLPPI